VSRRRRRRSSAGLIVAVAILAAAGTYLAGVGQAHSSQDVAPAPQTTAPHAAPAAAGSWQLIQEPQAGTAGLQQLITGAQRSIDMTMYELQDPELEGQLTAAAKRGVKVRVILDAAYSGRKANASAYATLDAGGVEVKWAPADTVVHQKTMTVDAGTAAAAAAIGTGNLQQQYYASTLDAWILDRDEAQVSAVEATFASDWAAAPGRLGTADQAAGLVWSPGDQAQMVTVIDDARKSVQFSSEELSDTAVIDALAARARAGVTCQVLMTEQDEYDQALRQLQQAGCSVRTYADKTGVLYVHEKQLIVDGAELVIGSQNASVASLDYDRELSVVLTSSDAAAVVNSAESTYRSAFDAAPAFD